MAIDSLLILHSLIVTGASELVEIFAHEELFIVVLYCFIIFYYSDQTICAYRDIIANSLRR